MLGHRIVLFCSVGFGCAFGILGACGGLAPDDLTFPPPDSGLPDAPGADASDGGPDAMTDSSPDATSDSSPDAMSEAGPSPEAAPDSGPDAFDAAPECWSLDFEAGPPVTLASVCQSGVQNVPAGMTPSGSTFLVQSGLTGTCSAGLSAFIADEIPAGSGVYKLVQVPPLAGADPSVEEGVTLMPDGLTLITLNAAHDGFYTSTRSAVGLVDFSTPVVGDFAQITTSGGAAVWAPVISPDGLAFYYTVQGAADPSANGIYESVRSSTNVPFPVATMMPVIVQNYAQYVNGTSTDRLAIFLTAANDVGSAMFTRKTLSDPFSNPLAPSAPPAAPLRARPLAGCKVLVGSNTPGGCIHETVATWQVR